MIKFSFCEAFVITQHIRHKELIENIKEFLCCGHLIKDTESKIQYPITGINNLENKLFREALLDQYALITKKSLDAEVFREIYSWAKKGIKKSKIFFSSYVKIF
ncbi:hypothetical protein EON69_00755 [bacterium]|nr:MAG: hypothetical protein EON69_00755 [bacterium]